jgi:2-dehydro-3-deoxyphosphogalactonate aldolase
MSHIDTAHRLVAILRGLRPEETQETVAMLLEEGFRAIEIPLNSPDPFRSIEIAVRVAQEHGQGDARIGAGTVLHPRDVERLKALGANLVVTPNTDTAVIQAARNAAMHVYPGVFTPSEAHQAVAAGASGLKFFPASVLGASGIKAIMTVLPTDTRCYAVGGVCPDDFATYGAAGLYGFGLGSDLYRPGMELQQIRTNARAAIKARAALVGAS